MRQRLLFVLHCYFDLAGTEEHTRGLANGLGDRFQVSILFPHERKLWLTDDGKKFECFPAETSRFYWSLQPLSAPTTLKSFGHVLDKTNPDIIHIQHLAGWSLDTLAFINQSGFPLVMSLHDYYCVTPAFIVSNDWNPESTVSSEHAQAVFGTDVSTYLRERREILRSELPKIDRFVVPSNHLARDIQRVFSLQCTVIPHGIREFSRVSRNPQPAAFVFAFIGNMLPHKGWRSLLHGFRQVRSRYRNAQLHFYGTPKNIRAIRQDGVFLFGQYKPAQLPDIFSRVDVVVIPSVTAESFCLVLSEAWMAGLPVAASNIGALAERITHHVDGILFEPGNPESIAEALRWFLENDAWKTWSYPIPKSLEQMCDEYAALYMELL